MAEILLQTKLFVPPIRPSLVPRPHLIQKLNRGLQQGCKLTLISAPAGFGKTTLVSEWLADGERPFAWLSLDEGDADLTRFLTYFVAALRTVAAHVGERVLTMLQSPPLLPTESLLTTLLNDITTISQQFLFVLDDYHVVDARSVDEALTFLLEHLPPQMHLVITTREDPNLPLARWRVRNQLTELRVNDLRFNVAETAVSLNQVTGLELSTEDIAALENRTEGWIAGLQLAALSMQGRADVHGFIEAFAGDDRYIVDYLVAEVLQRQPENIRRFLLHTSILNRLSGRHPFSMGPQPTYEHTSSPTKALLALNDAEHMIFTNTCESIPWYTKLLVGEFCSDSVWIRNQAHDLIGHFTTAFLLAELKQDKDASVALAPNSVNFYRVTYEAEGY